MAIVYFGDFFLSESLYYVPFEHLREVTTDDLFNRRSELHDTQGLYAKHGDLEPTESEKIDALRELHYVDSVLVDRMVEVRYTNRSSGSKVFISHSSKDKKLAKWLATDMKAAGHTPWLDEWSIKVGESIPKKIADGLGACDFVVVIFPKMR